MQITYICKYFCSSKFYHSSLHLSLKLIFGCMVCISFSIPALQRCSPHTLQFTPFKVFKWLVYSHHGSLQNVFISQRNPVRAHQHPPPFSPSSGPGSHLSAVCLSEFAYWGHCLYVCGGFFIEPNVFRARCHGSRLGTPFFSCMDSCPVCPLTDMLVVPTLWLLRIMLL